MLLNQVPIKVLLPKQILALKGDKERFEKQILSYLQKSYPEFIMIGQEDCFALCKWRGGGYL